MSRGPLHFEFFKAFFCFDLIVVVVVVVAVVRQIPLTVLDFFP